MRKFLLAALVCWAALVQAQVQAPPLINQRGTTPPTVCAVGQLFFKTDATAGQNIYQCAAANTWTQQLNSGGVATPVSPGNGGTGVANNASSTLTISGNFATTLTVTGATGVTLPTSGTLATTAGNVATATALAADPTDCAANNFANAIAASGNLTCAQPSISAGISGLGANVATALGVAVGSAGAPVVNGGALGTPSSGTLTSATGLPVSSGISGLGTNVATALAVNVGTAGAPVVLNGAGGTPSSLTLTNATGYPAAQMPAVLLTSGTSRTIANTAEIIVCTGTCTVTPPGTLTAGSQFCVQNDDNVSTVITLAAVTNVQYEATARTSYGTANHTMTSGGAVKDQICFVAVSTTKYNMFSNVGTWTNN